jgi:hypothetical protein
VQEAYGDLICAMALRHRELVPASRYIQAGLFFMRGLPLRPPFSQDHAIRISGVHQVLRILVATGPVDAADAATALNIVLWGLGKPRWPAALKQPNSWHPTRALPARCCDCTQARPQWLCSR